MTDAENLLDAALPHVAFDGWGDETLAMAAADAGIEIEAAKALFPRGGVDMALAYHRRGDRAMVEKMKAADMTGLRFRDRIALGVKLRLEDADRELVRRGMTLFSLPQNAAEGAQAIWQTAGLIWESLGDTSRDVNWYTKRATLSAVYSSTVLFWLGDDSDGHQATWDFLDRRIENVMQFEKFKGKARESKLFQAFMQGPGRFIDQIRAPGTPRADYPGHWGEGENEK